LSLVEGLSRRGHPAVLIASPRSELYRRARASGLDPVGIHAFNEADPQAIVRIAIEIARRRPAIFHLHTSHAHLLGLLASALGPRVRRVVARRVDFSIFRHSFLGLNWIKYRYGVDRYLAVSAAVGSLLVREGVAPERVSIVRSGVDPARFAGVGALDREALLRELGLPAGLPLIVAIGALADHKGHRYLIEAAPRVLRERDAAIVVAGSGPRRRALERQARRLKLEGRVKLAGFRPEVGALLKSASVFVFPSLEEGLGTSVLDALALEVPVVATAVGGIPEMITHGREGLLVPPRDAGSLAEAILEVLRHPARAAERARSGRTRVQAEFSAERMVEETLGVYREIVEGVQSTLRG
jgi:glycosyltransferase involved in cell wall biosynthesis